MREHADYLLERIEAGDIPSASWLVAGAGGVLDAGAVGLASVVPEKAAASTETIYDLASLTKPLVTSPLIVVLARHEGVGFSSPAARFLPEFSRSDKRDITLGHLLTHTSGLPDWAPLYLGGESVPEYLRQIREMDLLDRPGSKVRYSDLGYIALGATAEKLGSSTLPDLARSFVIAPAKAKAVFNPGPDLRGRVAATEEACNYERRKAGPSAASYTRFRTGVIHGEVHDQNAWAVGGAAGHAGLFGTAMDVQLMARDAIWPTSGIIHPDEAKLLREAQTARLSEPRSFAYRINRDEAGQSDETTAAGPHLPPEAFGHNGFTGTSVWIDPRAGRLYVLLTNRVHPQVREEVDMNAIRREFHRRAAAS